MGSAITKDFDVDIFSVKIFLRHRVKLSSLLVPNDNFSVLSPELSMASVL